MPLAEYLASEQARDRLKTADVLTMPSASEWHGHGQKVVIEQCEAWWRVSVTVADETTAAYYRFDGARYVVTDLGEGARALRLKGVGLLDISDKVRAVLSALWVAADDNEKLRTPFELTHAEIGYPTPIAAAFLPDAICRVMLASLRVMEAAL